MAQGGTGNSALFKDSKSSKSLNGWLDANLRDLSPTTRRWVTQSSQPSAKIMPGTPPDKLLNNPCASPARRIRSKQSQALEEPQHVQEEPAPRGEGAGPPKQLMPAVAAFPVPAKQVPMDGAAAAVPKRKATNYRYHGGRTDESQKRIYQNKTYGTCFTC